MTVLITNADMDYALTVVQSLGRHGIHVTVAGDSFSRNKAFYSKYCKKRLIYPKPENEGAFIKVMKKVAKNYELLIPIHESVIVPISKHLKEFIGLTKVPIPDYKVLEVALDKIKTIKIAQKIGIPTPHTFFIDNLRDVKLLSRKIKYPVVIKLRKEISFPPPRYVYAHSPEDLIIKYKLMHNKTPYPLIQELIRGQGYGFFTLFNENSKPVAVFCHKRLREYPVTGGPSAYCESVLEPKIINYGLKLLKKIKWYGVAMVEFKLDEKDNTFKLMEINPRFWGSLPLAIASGVDFPYLLYNMTIGNSTTSHFRYKVGIRCRFLFRDLLALRQGLKSNNKIKYFSNFTRSFFDRNVVYGDITLRDLGPTGYRLLSRIRNMITKKARASPGRDKYCP